MAAVKVTVRSALTNSPGAIGSVGWEAGWDIDSDFLGEWEAVVDETDGFQSRAGGRPVEAGTEDGVDDESGEVGVAWEAPLRLGNHRL